jgi:hypothetical protein
LALLICLVSLIVFIIEVLKHSDNVEKLSNLSGRKLIRVIVVYILDRRREVTFQLLVGELVRFEVHLRFHALIFHLIAL